MNVASAFAEKTLDEIMALLAGGTLTIYSVARPVSADLPVDRSIALASFTFATPAFAAAQGELQTPCFTQDAVPASSVGTPGFARACLADGTVIADFSAGPGTREIKFNEVSFSNGTPVRITAFRFLTDGSWPERPDYYETRPRSGFPLHTAP
jgi:hypothetical protein